MIEDRPQMSDVGKQIPASTLFPLFSVLLLPTSDQYLLVPALSPHLIKPFLFNSGGLSSEFAQVINFCAPHAAPSNDFDSTDDG